MTSSTNAAQPAPMPQPQGITFDAERDARNVQALELPERPRGAVPDVQSGHEVKR